MPVWKLIVEYEGTRYHGWQEQKGARTVGGEIRNAAARFFEGRVDLSGSGRTDAGVHALGQVARLSAPRRVKPEELRRAINDNLPPDINILKAEAVDDRFDPRRDAIGRYYIYQISTRRTAFAKKFVWWVKDSLDIESMSLASASLVGRHDFARFCELRDDERSTLVVVERSELQLAGDLLLFRIGASHFLWKMVRRIVGMLVEVGRGTLSHQEFASLIENGKKTNAALAMTVAASTAPPSGLFLERVVYRGQSPPGVLAPAIPVVKWHQL